MKVTEALQPVVEVLERLGVAYHVGGSVASSVHGSPRATNDVDLVVDLRTEHVEWYRDGGEVSDRQGSDVLGVLRARGPQLDRAYLDRWAQHVGITALLARAVRDSGTA